MKPATKTNGMRLACRVLAEEARTKLLFDVSYSKEELAAFRVLAAELDARAAGHKGKKVSANG